MSEPNDAAVTVPASVEPPSPGAVLRGARAAAGLSVDDVAHQLKLAPRQVQAIEAGDYAQLPGRTFVRGFLRNYARLLGLDADALLATLPEGGSASLDRPTLGPTARVMGELPADTTARGRSARWAIPLVILAIAALAAVYLWRPVAAPTGGSSSEQAVPMLPGAMAPAAPAAAPRPDAPPPVAPAVASVEPPPSTSPAATPAAIPRVETPVAATPGASDTPLVLVFRGTSWVEVKDARGNVLLSTMGYPGATHAVGGTLPLEVVLGNAEAVQVSVRGEPFDAAPYIKQNVAKFQVK